MSYALSAFVAMVVPDQLGLTFPSFSYHDIELLFDVADCQTWTKEIQKSSRSGWKIARLRYFNPVGAHPSGIIGESPSITPNNLFPMICDVAMGKKDNLEVFGDDWPTMDGTGIRDYIHVMDLASGHLAALNFLLDSRPQLLTLNLGTGQGYSVLEMIKAFEEASGQRIPYEIVERRPGDAATSFTDPSKALKDFGWRAEFGLERMCDDAWRWQSAHPEGFV